MKSFFVHNKMGNSLSERDKNEAEYGERIYQMVQQIYPESSENITGMLLELEHQELERLLTTTNQKELYARIHQAAENMPSSDAPERVEQAKHNGAGYHGNGHDKLCNPSNIENLKLQNLRETKYGKSKKSESSNPTSEMFTVDNGDLETKHSLGEKIYSLIENQYPNDAEKLTGILLEMDNESLEHLITDTDLLEKKVEEVFSVLQNHTGQIQNGQNSGENEAELEQAYNKTSIGEELFELVSALDCDQADKITGMFLEMDLHDLEELVKNQAALEEKVNQALAALNNQFIKDEEVGEIDEEDKTLLGEQLYYLITEWYPDQADKITGMLLELDVTTLNLLVKDSAALKEKATHAANVLSNTIVDNEIPHDLASTGNSVEESEDKMLSDSEMRRSLAEQLYSIVEKWYPNEAGKLTGMLMDNDCATLKSFVLNEQLLERKLDEALAVLHRTQQTIRHRDSANQHNKEDIAKEELGDKLYQKVEELHPENADKITGMLLEMSVEDIERILTSPQDLQEKIELAENALS